VRRFIAALLGPKALNHRRFARLESGEESPHSKERGDSSPLCPAQKR
jgi:hypothetical protein